MNVIATLHPFHLMGTLQFLGHWIINGVKTQDKALGDKGDKGDKGDPGKDGINGEQVL